MLTSPFVLANPQNGWQVHLLPYLKPLFTGPSSEPWASAFWDGLPVGTPIPWHLWVLPVSMWSLFAVALVLFSISLAGFLGRHWIEHDRLAFPHAEVLMGMARNFLSSRLFWWGVATAAAVPAWNLLQRFLTVFPPISLYFGPGGSNGVEWLQGADKLILVLDFMVLGLFYFVHRDIVISMCVFFFLVAIEKYLLGLAGIQLQHGDLYSMGGGAANWQAVGALLAFVVLGLWSARRWLAGYFMDAWHGRGMEKSWLPPRWNVIAFAGSFIFLAVWMVLLGLSGRGLVAFMFSKALAYIGMARITAETAIETRIPIHPQDFAVLLGTRFIAPAGFVALALGYCWLGDVQLGMTGRMAQAERMRAEFRFPRRMIWVIVAAVGISTAVAMYSTVWLGYTHAANNFGTWAYTIHARHYFDQVVECARVETGPDWARMGWFTIGVGIVGVLVFLRNHVIGWFLHPIGFVVAGGARAASELVFVGILAWSAKTLILKLGGVDAYEKYKPYFAGLVVGAFLPWALGMFLDPVFFPRRGVAMPVID